MGKPPSLDHDGDENLRTAAPERFQAKACPALDAGWRPVRVKKTRQTNNLEPRFDSIEAEKALVDRPPNHHGEFLRQTIGHLSGHRYLALAFELLDRGLGVGTDGAGR